MVTIAYVILYKNTSLIHTPILSLTHPAITHHHHTFTHTPIIQHSPSIHPSYTHSHTQHSPIMLYTQSFCLSHTHHTLIIHHLSHTHTYIISHTPTHTFTHALILSTLTQHHSSIIPSLSHPYFTISHSFSFCSFIRQSLPSFISRSSLTKFLVLFEV